MVDYESRLTESRSQLEVSLSFRLLPLNYCQAEYLVLLVGINLKEMVYLGVLVEERVCVCYLITVDISLALKKKICKSRKLKCNS